MYEELEAVLDEHVRPLLWGDGGDMEVLEVEDGVVRFKLGCPAADLTTEALIQSELVERVPGIRKAVLVQDISDELLDQARAIIRSHHGG